MKMSRFGGTADAVAPSAAGAETASGSAARAALPALAEATDDVDRADAVAARHGGDNVEVRCTWQCDCGGVSCDCFVASRLCAMLCRWQRSLK